MNFFFDKFKPNPNGYFITEEEFKLLYSKMNELEEINKLRDEGF